MASATSRSRPRCCKCVDSWSGARPRSSSTPIPRASTSWCAGPPPAEGGRRRYPYLCVRRPGRTGVISGPSSARDHSWSPSMNTNALPFGLGAILLGAAGIWFHDFAMQWQPVPPDFPLRMQFAIVTGLLLILGGGETLSGKWAHGGAALLAAIYGLWVVILHVPLI